MTLVSIDKNKLLPKQAVHDWTSNPRVRGLVTQIVAVLAVVLFVLLIGYNAATNLQERNIASGFGFLLRPAGFDISFSMISYRPTDTYGRVIVIGLLNTLLIACLGCFLATLLGFLLGILRLSSNVLAATAVYWYTELARNIPLLLQIIFWWVALSFSLPPISRAIDLGFGAHLSKKGIHLPAPTTTPGLLPFALALFTAVAVSIFMIRWSARKQERTGKRRPVIGFCALALVALPAAAITTLGTPVVWDIPVIGRFNASGGVTLQPELVALLLGLVIYTSAFIAEIVRSGIQSVGRGQREAATALGLRFAPIMRLIIIPQAMRVIVPQLTLQYLNLLKNSSLGVAIGYPELMSLVAGSVNNQTGQAIETIAITMAIYLSISLCTAAFMNWYNQRVAMVER